MKNVTILLAVVAVVALAGPASGSQYNFDDGDPNDHLWSSVANWSPDGLARAGYDAKVNSGYLCEINSAATSDRVYAGLISAGEIKVLTGGSLTVDDLDVGWGCSSTTTGKLTQTAGAGAVTVANKISIGFPYDASRPGDGLYTISGGSLSSGDFQVGDTGAIGVFKVVGTVPSSISIGGTYTQIAGSTLEIVLDTTNTGVRKIAVTGVATLAGELDVTASGTLAKSEYLLMSFASHIGDFTLDEHLDGDNWDLEYRSGGTELWLVPEPATLSLLALGGISALIRRRRK